MARNGRRRHGPANYALRLVEARRGRSVVEFRYAPDSVRLGAAVPGTTLIALAMLMWRTRRRRPASSEHASENHP